MTKLMMTFVSYERSKVCSSVQQDKSTYGWFCGKITTQLTRSALCTRPRRSPHKTQRPMDWFGLLDN